jgi:hypothetical protein
MYSDEDEATLTLPKWPFYLGDVSLILIALTIATLGNWELEGIQVVACVLAVALGAAVLVLPFVTEYMMRVREQKEDRASEVRLFKKQLERAEAALLKQHEWLKQIESRSGLDDQRYELLASAIDQKTQVELPDLTAMIERIEVIEASGAKQTKASDTFKKELADLVEAVKSAVDSLNALQSRLDTLEKTDQKSSTDSVEEPSEVTAARKRQKKKEANLLKRAIQEKQDTASTAVSRIIDPESKQVIPNGETVAADLSKREDPAEVSEVEATEVKNPETDVAAPEIFSDIEMLPDDFSVSLGADLMMDDGFFADGEIAKSEKSKKSAASKKAKKSTAPNKEKTVPAAEKSTITTVEVKKLMGIGNKPFLRGSGAGLSWEKGVEMEFQEIGKWTWSAPANLSEVIEIQIYSNDGDADHKGKYTLQLGQRLEIIPEF